ncbi:MAG: heme ABC transporter ATP-binding protein [Candidatus Thermoplasmatota archaeon]|nr:heme ABC transporter ATP-binding protein [Candidatus Thermoplasmatota archaeon]
MIEVEGLTFSYNGGAPVLEKVDLSVKKGEMLGILGPNGSGKSTLIKLVSGALAPDRGQVLLDGKDISRTKRREIARKLAVVPQETDLVFDFTVREVVSMGRYPHLGRFQFDDPHSKKILEGAMGITGVVRFADKPFSKLSGGEKQRAIIARALAQEPKVLLLDEPTKNLDVRHSLDIMSMVRKMNRENGLTVIVVVHDLDLAARFCSRIILLKNGKINKDGPIDRVLTPENIEQVFDVRSRVHRDVGMRIEIID